VEFLLGKARPVARPGPSRGRQPEDHGQREQDERDDPDTVVDNVTVIETLTE